MEAQPPLRSRGDFGQTPAARLLWELATRRFTGTLVVHGHPHAGALRGESMFAFEDGLLAQARLPQPIDTLGVVLLEANLITHEQLDASIERVLAEEGLQGAVLASLGACDRAAVEWGLQAQLCRKVLRLFALPGGPFEAHADIDLLADFGGRRIPVDVVPLLWDGVRANPEHPSVETALGRIGKKWFRLVPDHVAASMFTDDEVERALLERVQRPTRLSDLLDLGAPPLVARAFAALLMMTRQIERVAAPVSQLPPSEETGVRPTGISSPFIVPVSPSSPFVVPVGGIAGSQPGTDRPLGPVSLPPFAQGASAARAANESGHTPVNLRRTAETEEDRAAARQAELQRGEQHLRQQRYADAEQSARVVLLEDSTDIDALLLLASALLEGHGTARIGEVKKCIATALADAPQNDRAFIVAANMYRRTGDEKRAFTCFAKAYKLNPRNIDAMREIRLATMRRRNEREPVESEGFLAKLFGTR